MNKNAIFGYIGLALVQFNCIPAIVVALQQKTHAPIASIVLMVLGLTSFLVYDLREKVFSVYTLGNIIGVIGNLILLISCIM